MKDLPDQQVKAAILHKLYWRGCWGGKHTAFENLKKGFKPKELGRKGLRRVDDLAKELIREGYIIPKPTSYGLQVSLNPRRANDIRRIVGAIIDNNFSHEEKYS